MKMLIFSICVKGKFIELGIFDSKQKQCTTALSWNTQTKRLHGDETEALGSLNLKSRLTVLPNKSFDGLLGGSGHTFNGSPTVSATSSDDDIFNILEAAQTQSDVV